MVEGNSRKRERHGERSSPEYEVWCGMKKRCYNRRCECYERYGGRGITVCERWRASFSAFLADMGRRPSSKHTLERKENDGPYNPENCVWATAKEQARNRRSSAILTLNGVSRTIAEWSEVTGLSTHTIGARVNRYGWTVEKALTFPADGSSRNSPTLQDKDNQAEVIRLYKAGESLSAIGRRFRIGKDAIKKLLARLNWGR
jgi:hypothetical protein